MLFRSGQQLSHIVGAGNSLKESITWVHFGEKGMSESPICHLPHAGMQRKEARELALDGISVSESPNHQQPFLERGLKLNYHAPMDTPEVKL